MLRAGGNAFSILTQGQIGLIQNSSPFFHGIAPLDLGIFVGITNNQFFQRKKQLLRMSLGEGRQGRPPLVY
jgi:hypothetical protein